MQNYMTTEEKASEWDISSRHLQYLCRTGKIEGAVKRAGSWFIPKDVPISIKNMKSGAVGFRFVGTKSRIFNSAIKLFVLRGVDGVSLRDIADSVGIRQSTIYNHFKSKQEILDTIYDYYCHFYRKERPSLEKMETVIQEENPMGIIGHIRYDFDEEHLGQLTDITKIIFQRLGMDGRATEIAQSVMLQEGVQYVEEVLDRAVETGRFALFDTHAMAVFINCVRIFTLYNWIIDPSPENMASVAEDEQKLYRYATKFIEDLKPSATSE